MTLSTVAWMHNGLAHDAKDGRQLVGSTWGSTGIVDTGDFLVEQQTVAAATLKVAAGALVIAADGAGLFGKYHVWNDASLNTGSFDPTSGNGRKDRLICRVTNGVPALEIVKGTAAASPAEPSITGNNYEELALITMPATASTVLTAYITDRRRRAVTRGGVPQTVQTRTTMTADRSFSAGAPAAGIPTNACQATIVKRRADTALLCQITIPRLGGFLGPSLVTMYARVNGVNNTAISYVDAPTTVNVLAHGSVRITGLAAGSWTVEIYVACATNAVIIGNASTVELTVTETL